MTDRDGGSLLPQKVFNGHLPSFLASTCLLFRCLTKVFASILIHDHLPFLRRNHLPSPESNHLPLGYLLTKGERRLAALPLLLRGKLRTHGELIRLGRCLSILRCCMSASSGSPEEVTMMQRKGNKPS